MYVSRLFFFHGALIYNFDPIYLSLCATSCCFLGTGAYSAIFTYDNLSSIVETQNKAIFLCWKEFPIFICTFQKDFFGSVYKEECNKRSQIRRLVKLCLWSIFFLTFDFFIFSFHFFVFTFSAPNIRESISSSCHVDYINTGSVCCGWGFICFRCISSSYSWLSWTCWLGNRLRVITFLQRACCRWTLTRRWLPRRL